MKNTMKQSWTGLIVSHAFRNGQAVKPHCWLPAFSLVYFQTCFLTCCLAASIMVSSYQATASGLPAKEKMPEEAPMLLTDHPLVNSIWDVKTGNNISKEELFSALPTAKFLMFGEKHDNPIHHEKQAILVKKLRQAGMTGQIVLEMAEQRHQESLDSADLATLDHLGAAIKWKARGWPDWSLYQPILAEALRAGMRVKAGNPDRALMMQIGQGLEADEADLQNIRWERDYTPAHREDLLDELVQAHCGMMERDQLGPLVTMQRLKDAFMGRSMRQGRKKDHLSILIAGNGHIRKDRGVKMFLDETDSLLTVAMIEVVREETNPTDYPSFDPALYDYIWFTPRVDEIDPCEKFRSQLEAMKSRMQKPDAGKSKKHGQDIN